MRALIVVMHNVLAEHPAEVAFQGDQQPVQAFASTASDPSFGVRVRPGRHQRIRKWWWTQPPSIRTNSTYLAPYQWRWISLLRACRQTGELPLVKASRSSSTAAPEAPGEA